MFPKFIKYSPRTYSTACFATIKKKKKVIFAQYCAPLFLAGVEGSNISFKIENINYWLYF